jgi:hypothetical protein
MDDNATCTKPLRGRGNRQLVLCQDDCAAVVAAVIWPGDAIDHSAFPVCEQLEMKALYNPHKSNRPAKVRRLTTSTCIGNAPAISLISHRQPYSAGCTPDTTLMSFRPPAACCHVRHPKEG